MTKSTGKKLAREYMESTLGMPGARVVPGTSDQIIEKLQAAGLVDEFGEATRYGVDVTCKRL